MWRMSLQKLQVYFETAPSLRLLKAVHAPFIIDFLQSQFKQSARTAVPHEELRSALDAYREDVHEDYPNAMKEPGDRYLSDWCSSETRWLKRFYDDASPEPQYSLTPHTEDVFSFLDGVLDQDLGFIGTQSRLKLIIETLTELAVQSSDDPRIRLAHLRQEKERLEGEIAEIEQQGSVSKEHPALIRERFATAISILRQLQSDFRGVEENFKAITREIQGRQARQTDVRGDILAFALDSEDMLKNEDQGVSFNEFARLILSPAEREKLQTLIRQIVRIEELASDLKGMESLRRMVPSLLSEANNVMKTSQRLSAALRRLLDGQTREESQRVHELLQEIKSVAARLASDPPSDREVWIMVDDSIRLHSALSRTFWVEPTEFERIDMVQFDSQDADREEALRRYAALKRLDWQAMRSRVTRIVHERGAATLGALIKAFPPEAGSVEILGYIQLAQDDGHQIDKGVREHVELSYAGRRVRWSLPLVTFVKCSRPAGPECGSTDPLARTAALEPRRAETDQ
jgi:hypothetical protein